MEKENTENLFEQIKKRRLEKFLKVGFTPEQAELLVEELQQSSMGMGSLF